MCLTEKGLVSNKLCSDMSYDAIGGVLAAQLCLTLCGPMNCSLPGSSVHGIFQARVLEWVAISFSRQTANVQDKGSSSKATVNLEERDKRQVNQQMLTAPTKQQKNQQGEFSIKTHRKEAFGEGKMTTSQNS